MGRASRADAAQHREEVVHATSRLLRERGSAGISVQDVMSAAGLTHGGFYKHFASKDELMGIAATEAFEEVLVRMAAMTRDEVVQDYLSVGHRDDPGHGCACTALAPDAAQAEVGSPLRTAYGEGLEKTLDAFAGYETDAEEARRKAVLELATLVGAVTLARAAGQTPLSEEILATVLAELT
ncbi:TetR family transcriptional regulator [Kribbella antibiotica]|uniref:TetR family transcriptional regulator n=1 Tax=Kribbella antibiotica TaxID=190195 RepID=A0A4R4ZNS7_9ACTN|nr:TetR family transcriptional regulator [Kribbella antibiotica]TDD59624.1 TetR family transcriptional regulator [Kribbella antibiotica]